jgi:hypothetical protein
MNVKENDELLVYKYQPTKSFYITRGFAKVEPPSTKRSPDQHEKILSKFLIDYLNRKTVLERIDPKALRRNNHKQIVKDDRRIDPSFTYRVGKSFRRKVRSSNSHYEETHSRIYELNRLNPEKTFLI